mgnify:FL=1
MTPEITEFATDIADIHIFTHPAGIHEQILIDGPGEKVRQHRNEREYRYHQHQSAGTLYQYRLQFRIHVLEESEDLHFLGILLLYLLILGHTDVRFLLVMLP